MTATAGGDLHRQHVTVLVACGLAEQTAGEEESMRC
jgi:hypothetical protein